VLGAVCWPERAETVIVVGHQPTLGRVAALLLAGEEAEWSVRKGAIWWLTTRHRENLQQVVLRAVLAPDML
jgi:phosphohistidine phosphatase